MFLYEGLERPHARRTRFQSLKQVSHLVLEDLLLFISSKPAQGFINQPKLTLQATNYPLSSVQSTLKLHPRPEVPAQHRGAV